MSSSTRRVRVGLIFGRIRLCLRRNCNTEERMRVSRDWQGQRVGFIAQCVAGGGGAQLGNRGDIAAVNHFDLDLFFATQQMQGSETFFAALFWFQTRELPLIMPE